MQRTLSSIFWDFYAFCYDGVRELRPYQEMLEEVIEALDLKPGMKVLDAGCGTGNLEELIAERYPNVEVVAVDFSPAMLGRAKKKAVSRTIHFRELDLNQPLPFPANYFDRVVCVNTFYNLKDHKKTLGEFKRMLRMGGILVLTTSKKGNSPSAILRAHRGLMAGVTDSGLLGWLKEITASFGTAKLLFRMILLALCNKVLLKTMKEFEAGELEELACCARLYVLQTHLTYAEQGIFLKAMKLEFVERGVIYKIALTEKEKEASFRLRYEGYCLDMGGIEKKYCPGGLEKEEYDNHAIHFIATENIRTIGTLRLIPAREDSFPIEEFFSWPSCISRSQALEASRLYVARDKRGGAKVMQGLFQLAFEYSQNANYRYWCFASLPAPLHIMEKWGWKMWIFDERKQIRIPTSQNFIADFTPVIVELNKDSIRFPL